MLSIRLQICVNPWRYSQYTGGTTGLPKGAMLTHANLSSATAQYVETTHTEPPLLGEGRERILAVLPPFHIYALTVNMLIGIRIGAEMILHTRFDTAAVVKDICEKKVTVFPGVPTMYVAIINHPGVENLDLSSIKWCASGGAPPSLWRCRSAFRTFPAAGWPRAGE